MSHAIREKPRWWEKVKDPKTMARWRKEALEQQEPLPRHRRLTEVMVSSCRDGQRRPQLSRDAAGRPCAGRVARLRCVAR